MTEHGWPALPYEEWAPTKKTLHMCTQMLGKAKLALMPPQPEWLHAGLHLDGRGFSTGAMPHGSTVVAMGIDLFDLAIWMRASDGRTATVPLGDGRSVADTWAGFRDSLAQLGLRLDIWEKPQEVPDTTAFSQNTYGCTINPEQAQRFYWVLAAIDGAYERFRSPFFGRSAIQFWWGTFDFAVLLFTGTQLTAPEDMGYIMRYDLDAEHMNAGFWPGDDHAPTPSFYAYLVPRPPGCEAAPIEPPHGDWVEAMGEWMLPYDKVRTLEDPANAILDFFNSVYRVALTLGGWDAEAHRYVLPGPPAGRS